MHLIKSLLIEGIKNKELIDWQIDIEGIVENESFKLISEIKLILDNEGIEEQKRFAQIQNLFFKYDILKMDKNKE